jgi:phage replication-related protein YjqB (UPF0714/DUF867 family)
MVSKMADKYCDFAQLSQYEIEGTDYIIGVQNRNTGLLVVSIHGGGIEPGTSELASMIAGNEHSWYDFNGIKQASNYQNLHITSTRFDEPLLLHQLPSHKMVLAIHGCTDGTAREEAIHIGGGNTPVICALKQYLLNQKIDARVYGDPTFINDCRGIENDNICNRAGSGVPTQHGVQLELTNSLRASCFACRELSRLGRKQPTSRLQQLAEVIRTVVHQYL